MAFCRRVNYVGRHGERPVLTGDDGSSRALITGITGMVGSHLAEFLLEKTDWDIFGMCRWRSPLDNLVNDRPRINRRTASRCCTATCATPCRSRRWWPDAKPDYVFHLAAQSFPRTSFDSPLDTLDTNVQGTVRVLEALRSTRPRPVIHVCASSEVFGRVPKEKLPIDEECTFHPASPYAISKVGTDLVGRFYAEAYGMTVMTTRMFTHTGPRRGDVFAESTFAKQIAMIEHNRIPPVVKVGNLQSLRTIADVRDAVRAYYLLVTVNPTPGAYYNIGGTHSCTVEGHARHADLVLAAPRTTSRSRSIPIGCARSTPTCRCPIPRSSRRIPAGSPRSRTRRRCATCSTTGATAWQRKATVF